MCRIIERPTRRCSTTLLLCLAATVATLTGCGRSGPAYWPISGRVTFQGKPVTVAEIHISNPKVGIDILETLDAEGRYTVITGDRKGLPEGQYRVAITPKLDFSRAKCGADGRPIPSTMPSEAERNPPNIPKKYHSPSTSGLTLTVKPESNTFNVDMQPAR